MYKRQGYLGADSAKRVAYYTAMSGLGAMTVNEIRRLEHLPPMDEPEVEPPVDVAPIAETPEAPAIEGVPNDQPE